MHRTAKCSRQVCGRLPALALAITLLLAAPIHAAVDVAALWDFAKPELSEARFRQALAGASGDDALILRTQIARSFGLRSDFERARRELAEAAPQIAQAGPEAQASYQLELGRSWVSATHAPEALTPQARDEARRAFGEAQRIARAGQLDALAVDALHMMAFVDDAPADQLRWNRAALDLALASNQPAARGWERSLRNNTGLALRALGQHAQALAEFEQLLALQRQQNARPLPMRISQWHIARSLRDLGRIEPALAIQLQLEREFDADKDPDPYVFEELELLYRAKGDAAQAERYAQRLKATPR